MFTSFVYNPNGIGVKDNRSLKSYIITHFMKFKDATSLYKENIPHHKLSTTREVQNKYGADCVQV